MDRARGAWSVAAVRRVTRGVLAPLVGVLATLCGCGAAQRREVAEAKAAIDEDLVALLPSGADGVIDLDVAQFRDWPAARRIWRRLPPRVSARLDRLGFDPFDDTDFIAVALRGAGTDGAEVTVVARGRLDPARLRAALTDEEGPADEVGYHGARVVDSARSSVAMLTDRTAVFGSRAEVRRAIDVALGNDEGLRQGDADRTVRAALGRSPEARSGRPAVVAALVPPPALRARLAENHFPVELIAWVSVAVAVGDGIDIGVVAAARDLAAADELGVRLRLQLDALKTQTSVRVLGLVPFIDVVQIGKKSNEVHLAFRLEQVRFDRLATRLENMLGRVANDAGTHGER